MACNLNKRPHFSSSDETDTADGVFEKQNLNLYLSDSDENEPKKLKVDCNVQSVDSNAKDSDVEIVGFVPGDDDGADVKIVAIEEGHGSGSSVANLESGINANSVANRHPQKSVMVEVRSNRNGSVWANSKAYDISSDDELPDLVSLTDAAVSQNPLGDDKVRHMYDGLWFG